MWVWHLPQRSVEVKGGVSAGAGHKKWVWLGLKYTVLVRWWSDIHYDKPEEHGHVKHM